MPRHELLPDCGEVVLGITGRHARRAAGALGEVDRHRPARVRAGVIAERGLLLLRLGPALARPLRVVGDLLLDEWMLARAKLARFREREHFDDPLPLLARVPLDAGEPTVVTRLRNRHAHQELAAAVGGGLLAEQLERVEGTIPRVAAMGGVPLTGGDGQDARHHGGRDPYRCTYRAIRRRQQDHVAALHLPLRRRPGVHLDPAMPGDLRHRVRQLLQPRLVGAATVVQRGVGEDEQRIAIIATRERRLGGNRARIQPDGPGRDVAVDAAVLHRFRPPLLEALPAATALVQRAPLALQVVPERAGLARGAQHHVARVHGVGEDGLHHRLLQRVDPGARPGIVPLLERVEVGEHQVSRARRFVQGGGERDREDTLAQGLRETAQRVHRIGAMDEQQRHLASRQVGLQRRGVTEPPGGGHGKVGTEQDRLADGAGDGVEDIHRGDDRGAVGVMGRHTARDREAGARGCEFARQALHDLGFDTRRPRDVLRGVGR